MDPPRSRKKRVRFALPIHFARKYYGQRMEPFLETPARYFGEFRPTHQHRIAFRRARDLLRIKTFEALIRKGQHNFPTLVRCPGKHLMGGLCLTQWKNGAHVRGSFS